MSDCDNVIYCNNVINCYYVIYHNNVMHYHNVMPFSVREENIRMLYIIAMQYIIM